MSPEITMKELIVLVLCFVLYVVAVEVYEARMETARQGQLVQQEYSFVYQPPSPPTNEDGSVVAIDVEDL